ncbi:MAG: DUF2303 family protein [Gammaproteobacteria bacterium]|nr:DUF2303 family protein [Gammaproteobacteria bacterium]
MDNTAIQEIHDNAAAVLLNRVTIPGTHVPIAALPENFKIHSLDQFQQHRSRFSGNFVTAHSSSFAKYHKSVDATTAVYIDPTEMTAEAIFDIGTTEEPGHCAHRARLVMLKTPPFKALETLAAKRESTQRELAEWLEDWRDYVTAINEDDADIAIKQLISTVRNVTIDSLKKVDSAEQNFSSTKTALEKIEASSSAGALPKLLIFTCEPYKDLPIQEFRFRISIRTGNDKPTFGVFRIQPDSDTETTADNFVKKLTDWLDVDAVIYQGEFSEKK